MLGAPRHLEEGSALSEFHRAIEASELPTGAKKAVKIGKTSVLLLNWKDEIHAVSNICSHAEEELECGRFGNGWIACPVHGARFDIVTGAAKNPPAKQPIATYE